MKLDEVKKISKKHARRLIAETEDCHSLMIMPGKEGKYTFALCVKKKCKSHKKLEGLELDGIPVTVIEMPMMHAFVTRMDKRRPAPGGVSVGHPDITAGTLGVWAGVGSTKYILSNNHIIANQNDANLEDDILQPGVYDWGDEWGIGETYAVDAKVEHQNIFYICTQAHNPPGGSAEPPDEEFWEVVDITIAKLKCFHPIEFDTLTPAVPNVDAALALPNNVNHIEDILLELLDDPTTQWCDAYYGLAIAKSGRTTDVTRGYVKAIGSGQVCYEVNELDECIKWAYFEDQIITTHDFGGPGDSGSLVIVDPLVDIAVVHDGDDERILVVEDDPADADNPRICITCCGWDVTPPGPEFCQACDDAGQETPSFVHIGLSGGSLCDEARDVCWNYGAGGSFKLTSDFRCTAYGYRAEINGVVGMLFAGNRATGQAILNPIKDVIDALAAADPGLTIDQWAATPSELAPLQIYAAHNNCSWHWNNYHPYPPGDFGDILVFPNETDCTGESRSEVLTRMELTIWQYWDAGAERLYVGVEAWVGTDIALPLNQIRFFIWGDEAGEAGFNNLCGCGSWASPMVCVSPPFPDEEPVGPWTGITMTARPASWEEAFEPFLRGGLEMRGSRPSPNTTPQLPPTIERMKSDYDMASAGMIRRGSQPISWERYLRHRQICIQCHGGYMCPHYCCPIQAQLATPNWKCKEGKY